MAQADLDTGILKVMTHFIEQHDRPKVPTEEEQQIFKEILHRFNGKMHIQHLTTLGLDQPLEWVRTHPECFHIFEDDDGKAVMVGVVSRGMRVCPEYNTGHRTPECRGTLCQAFHVCRDRVGGWCRAGEGCRREHSFTNAHNCRLTEWFHLDGFSCDELFQILAMSTPQVCSDYNRNGCRLVDRCTRIHVCRNFVAGICVAVNCDRAHNYESAHSQRLLHMYRLSALDADYVQRHLLFYRVKPQRMCDQGRFGGLRAAAVGCLDDDELSSDKLSVLPRVQQRFAVRTENTNESDDSGDESLPHQIEQRQPNKWSANFKTVLSGVPAKPVTSSATAGSREETCSAVPRLVSKLRTKPSTDVTNRRKRSTNLWRMTEGQERRNTAEIHIHTTAAEKIDICEKNIEGDCPLHSRCFDHHYPWPFLWQVNAFDKWVSLDDVNDIIESSFCDPSRNEILVQLPDIADGVYETEMYGNIKFTEMTMYVSLLDTKLSVRRLTTKSYICTEVDSCHLATMLFDDTAKSSKTKWIWYWQSSEGVWMRYKDQEQLEENYLSGRRECQFKVDGITVFVKQDELVQVNSQTGQRSYIRRRPKFSSTDHEKQ